MEKLYKVDSNLVFGRDNSFYIDKAAAQLKVKQLRKAYPRNSYYGQGAWFRVAEVRQYELKNLSKEEIEKRIKR